MASRFAHSRCRSDSARSRGLSILFSSLALALAPGTALTQQEAPDVQGEAAPEAPTYSVSGQFTTAIRDREPVDHVSFVANEVRTIFFFSELRGLNGRSVTHRWSYAGEPRAEVSFDVQGPRWRVWSSKDLLPDWIGDWTVEIVTDDGEVIAAETFTYSAPDA